MEISNEDNFLQLRWSGKFIAPSSRKEIKIMWNIRRKGIKIICGREGNKDNMFYFCLFLISVFLFNLLLLHLVN